MKEELQMLKDATFEIKNLRRQNELMRARLDMFDTMVIVLHTKIATESKGMSPDFLWEIEKFIAANEIAESKRV